MNKGQRQFRDFLIDRVKSGKEAEMESLLSKFFQKHDAGLLTDKYISDTEWDIRGLLRPECVAEFKQAGQPTKQSHKKG